jgi:hypothetical protein
VDPDQPQFLVDALLDRTSWSDRFSSDMMRAVSRRGHFPSKIPEGWKAHRRCAPDTAFDHEMRDNPARQQARQYTGSEDSEQSSSTHEAFI